MGDLSGSSMDEMCGLCWWVEYSVGGVGGEGRGVGDDLMEIIVVRVWSYWLVEDNTARRKSCIWKTWRRRLCTSCTYHDILMLYMTLISKIQ